jgi:hypothetical protein
MGYGEIANDFDFLTLHHAELFKLMNVIHFSSQPESLNTSLYRKTVAKKHQQIPWQNLPT